MTRPDLPRPLHLDLAQNKVTWGEVSLNCPRSLLPTLQELCRREDHRVSLADLQELAPRSGLSFPSLRSALYRWMRTMRERLGMSLLAPAADRDGFCLNVFYISSFEGLDTPDVEGTPQPHAPVGLPSWDVMERLIDAERLFEHGQYLQAAELYRQALGSNPHPEQETVARCMLCWAALRTSGRQAAQQATQELGRWFQAFSAQHKGLSDLAHARVLIQQARFEMSYFQRHEARAIFRRAERFLAADSWRERASIAAGIGFVELRYSNFVEAEYYFRESLRLSVLAGSPWQAQVQLCNLGAVMNSQFEVMAHEGLHGDRWSYLKEAEEFFLAADRICQKHGFEGGTEVELGMTLICTWQGRLDEAWVWMNRASELIGKNSLNYTYLLACSVRAELMLASGMTREALQQWLDSMLLESEQGKTIDVERILLRLRRLGFSLK